MNKKPDLQEMTDLWLSLHISDTLKNEIIHLQNNTKELHSRLMNGDLSFGTAGLRSLIGAGFNRINEYTIKKISLAIMQFLQQTGSLERMTIVISHDTRYLSKEFAEYAAQVFQDHEVSLVFFEEPTPTPILAYATKYYQAQMGIMITASHNPKDYNGFKVYQHNGAQINAHDAQSISDFNQQITQIPIFKPLDKKNWQAPDEKFYETYYQEILALLNPEIWKTCLIQVLYTPLFGSGFQFVKTMLAEKLKIPLDIVESQSFFDGHFQDLEAPNPEYLSSYEKALKKAQNKKYDIILATDPDSDRIGLFVKNKENEYQFLSGNDIGIIISYYLLSTKNYHKENYICSTVVSTDLVRNICKNFQVQYKVTLTGFKYLAELIEKNPSHFIMAFEESHGYLLGNYVLDKDGILGCALVAEIANYMKLEKKTLIDYLNEIQDQYGFYRTQSISFVYDDFDNKEAIIQFFQNENENLYGYPIEQKYDFSSQIFFNPYQKENLYPFEQFPQSNLIIFYLSPYFKVSIRPSGTEPIIKIYIELQAQKTEISEKLKEEFIAELRDFENHFMKNFIKIKK